MAASVSVKNDWVIVDKLIGFIDLKNHHDIPEGTIKDINTIAMNLISKDLASCGFYLGDLHNNGILEKILKPVEKIEIFEGFTRVKYSEKISIEVSAPKQPEPKQKDEDSYKPYYYSQIRHILFLSQSLKAFFKLSFS